VSTADVYTRAAMTFDLLKAGGVEIFAILDADDDTDPVDEVFPGWPAGEHERYGSIYPSLYGAKDTWRFICRGWLLHHGGGKILFDTGIGVGDAPGRVWLGSDGRLGSTLVETGTAPADIDTVVISHVHDDHIGGAVDANGSPAFPNARYMIHRADVEWQRAAANEDDYARDVWEQLIEPLEAGGVLDTVEGNLALSSETSLEHAPGHTPGHQIMWVGGDDDRILITADAFNHPAQLDHPDYPSGPDNDPIMAASTRRRLLAELAAAPRMIFAPTHFGEAFGRMATGPSHAVIWEPLRP
jgi:glyoxylase-like metal-dependent hydrolase (beta-lactamase superfamily II)